MIFPNIHCRIWLASNYLGFFYLCSWMILLECHFLSSYIPCFAKLTSYIKWVEVVVSPLFPLLLGIYTILELSLPSVFGRRCLKSHMDLYCFHWFFCLFLKGKLLSTGWPSLIMRHLFRFSVSSVCFGKLYFLGNGNFCLFSNLSWGFF